MGTDAVHREPKVFDQVYFHIIVSEDLPHQEALELSKRLQQHGAIEHVLPSRNGKIDLQGLTHIISTTIDFEGFEETEDKLVPVVTPQWVKVSLAKAKQSNPKSYSADPRMFFSGLVVYCVNLPPGDKDAIIGGVIATGGLYSASITKLVTHIVALNLDSEACQVALQKRLSCKIVLPHWFDDCLRLGKRIDETPYTLPNPAILLEPANSKVSVSPSKLSSASSLAPGSLRIPPESPSKFRQKLDVFADKKVRLSLDLYLGARLLGVVEGLIRAGGGEIVDDVNDADTLICQFREGDDYQAASAVGKTIGNLAWLYNLVTRNRWTSPLRWLLHYPVARHGLPGLNECKISLSNYNGEARLYLENLAKAAGSEFTKTMRMENTHLISAHLASEKCDAAREWNIHIVNHLWLEESYASWKVQSITNPRYTHFPPRTNLSELVGQTQIDREALETHFFDKKPRKRTTPTNKSVSMPMEPKDVNSASLPEPMDIDDPPPSSQSNHQEEADRPEQKAELKAMAKATPGQHKMAGKLSSDEIKTPARLADKENETPSRTGSRSAKEKAAARLQELAPDIALYEREKKRVGGVMYGGRRRVEDNASTSGRKRKSDSYDAVSENEEDDDEPAVKHAKKIKTDRVSLIAARLLVTGYAKWAEDSKAYNNAKSKLRDLGVLLTEDPLNCTHLAAPKILRTKKFVCAISCAPITISIDWVEACLKENMVVEEKEYELDDKEGERRYGFDLHDALERAEANNHKLLNGQTIFVDPHVTGGLESYQAIIEANGGRCLEFTTKVHRAISKRRTADDGEQDPEHLYLVSSSAPRDRDLLSQFEKEVREAGFVPRIVKNDWMLDLALRQQIRHNHSYDIARSM